MIWLFVEISFFYILFIRFVYHECFIYRYFIILNIIFMHIYPQRWIIKNPLNINLDIFLELNDGKNLNKYKN